MTVDLVLRLLEERDRWRSAFATVEAERDLYRAALDRIGGILELNGRDCDCGCDSDGHAGPILHMPREKARRLATRLVAVVGCEQVDHNTELLRQARKMLDDALENNHPGYEEWKALDDSIRAALEGR